MLPVSVRNQFYHPSVCHTCKSTENVKMCTKCKTLYYCSKDHQREDWPNHKGICEVISRTDKMIPASTQNVMEILEVARGATERQKYFLFVLDMWRNMLKRELEPYELDIPLFRKSCPVCNSRNAPIECKICSSVFYCCIAHQEIDDLSHAASCAAIKLNFQVLLFKYITPYKCTLKFCKKYVNVQIFPKNLESLIKILSEGSYFNGPKKLSLQQHLFFADSIAPIANILYGLEKTNLLNNHFLRSKELVVHIVGADVEEKNWDWCLLLEFAFHWIRNLKKLTYVAIGPKAENWAVTENNMKKRICGFCTMKPANVKCYSSPYYYHDIANKLEKPDIIVAFNCGIFLDPSWNLSISYLTKYPRVPLVLTDFKFSHMERNLQKINEYKFGKIEMILHSQRNPFSCVTPERSDFVLYPICYKNGYIAMLQSK